jgi:hypothetical protein
VARVVAIDLRAELDEQGRPCILFQFLTIDAKLEGGADVFEQRIPIEAGETVQQIGARVLAAARAQIPRLNAALELTGAAALTIGPNDVIMPSYTKG